MTKTRELSLAERHHVIGMFRAKMKKVAIAKEMGLGESTVRYVISKWLKSETVNSTPRSGRPSQLSERNARRLVRTSCCGLGFPQHTSTAYIAPCPEIYCDFRIA